MFDLRPHKDPTSEHLEGGESEPKAAVYPARPKGGIRIPWGELGKFHPEGGDLTRDPPTPPTFLSWDPHSWKPGNPEYRPWTPFPLDPHFGTFGRFGQSMGK